MEDDPDFDYVIEGMGRPDDRQPAYKAHVRGVAHRLDSLERELEQYHRDLEDAVAAHERGVRHAGEAATSALLITATFVGYLMFRHILGLPEGLSVGLGIAWGLVSNYFGLRAFRKAKARSRDFPRWQRWQGYF